MEHPVKEIPHLIQELTMGSPRAQKETLMTYFLPNAAFTHPLCRVSSFSGLSIPLLGPIDSRWVIWMIYRWYKILSPKIKLDVHSAVFDQKQQVLYVSISQIFHLFFVPFYRSDVSLVTVLKLSHDVGSNKYYIQSQEDHYQLNEFIKFILPGGATFFWLCQWCAALLCVVGSFLATPATWLEEKYAARKKIQ
ncbi:MAG: hypothetical protein M1818_007762 [Claussenomyces sp. TS43310]|nr:MAG: hypothetical protein M1818_007762 [Claussenomyces sp. TS43310]